jgi:hypothetical protein
MKTSPLLLAGLGLLLSACPPPPEPEGPSGEGSFQTDQDVNGINPNNATTSIFGFVKVDADNDGVFEQTVLEILTSSQADMCTRVGLGEFDGIDFPDGVHVDMFAVIQNDFTGGTIDANSAFILSAAILSKTNGTVDLVAASDFAAPTVNINLDTFDLEDGAIGSMTATLTEDASVDPPAAINVALSGSFEASHCQNLSTLLSQ